MHQVEDISFGFELPVNEPEEAIESVAPTPVAAAAPEPSPAAPSTARPASNTSAKRTPSTANSAPTPTQTTRITRSAGSPTPPQPASLPRSEVYDIGSDSSVDESPALAAGRARKRKASSLRNTTLVAEQQDEDPGEVGEPSAAATRTSGSPAQTAGSATRKSLRRQPAPGPGPSPLGLGGSFQAEEVDESPADAPGSGRRRPLRVGAGTPVIGSSTLLQRVLNDLDDTAEPAASSSPLQRVAARRRSSEARLSGEGTSAARSRTSTRLSGGSGSSGVNEEDELTPDRPQKRAAQSLKPRFKPNSEKRASLELTGAQEAQKEAVAEEPQEPQEPQEPEESEVAQEIDDEEAARRLATKKRPRRSLAAPPSADEAEEPEPAPKRRRRKEAASPAQQQQPKAKPPKKPTAKAKKAKKSAPADAENDTDADGGSVPVTVQRFTKIAQIGEDEPLAAMLNAEIPFGNRGGVNAVDVLSKLCEELIEAFLTRLESNIENAEDAAGRREQKTMLTSLQAFQEVLRTRLLEHVSEAPLVLLTSVLTFIPDHRPRYSPRPAEAGACGAKGKGHSPG